MISALSVTDILAPAHVHRWHMIRVKRTQTLAEHSFNVALLAGKIASLMKCHAEIMGEVLQFALLHDIHETEYGDMPTPAKKFVRSRNSNILTEMEDHFWLSRGAVPLGSYSEVVPRIVKLADMTEAYLFYRVEGDDDKITNRLRRDMHSYAERHFAAEPSVLGFMKELP